MKWQRTVNSVLTVCLSRGDNRIRVCCFRNIIGATEDEQRQSAPPALNELFETLTAWPVRLSRSGAN